MSIEEIQILVAGSGVMGRGIAASFAPRRHDDWRDVDVDDPRNQAAAPLARIIDSVGRRGPALLVDD